MRYGIWMNAVGLFLCVLLSASHAEAKMFCVGGSFGAGYLPMTDWQNFGSGLNSHYEADAAGLYGEVYGRVQLADRHSLAVSVERISKSAASVTHPSGFRVEWDFDAVPINVTYEFILRGSGSRTPSFFGLGAGVYHSQVHGATSNDPDFPPSSGQRDGWGYGFHGYLGQRAAVTQSLAVSMRVRGRWADGMYFTDEKEDIDVDFTGVDVALGVEFVF